LLAGPVSDLNVLARRGRVAAEAAVLTGDGRRRHPLGAGHVLLHVLQGGVSAGLAGSAARTALAPRESLWIRDAAPSDVLELQGGACVALLLRLGPATS
jgi:environmental stress-induced protein Ves